MGSFINSHPFAFIIGAVAVIWILIAYATRHSRTGQKLDQREKDLCERERALRTGKEELSKKEAQVASAVTIEQVKALKQQAEYFKARLDVREKELSGREQALQKKEARQTYISKVVKLSELSAREASLNQREAFLNQKEQYIDAGSTEQIAKREREVEFLKTQLDIREQELQRKANHQAYIEKEAKLSNLKKREALLAQKEQRIEELVESRVNQRMIEKASKSCCRPYFRDTAVFSLMTSPDALPDDKRLKTALSENATLSYPLRVETQLQGREGVYTVTLNSCTCKDFEFQKQPCKHMFRLAIELGLLLNASEKAKTVFLEKFTKVKTEADAAVAEKQRLISRNSRQNDYSQKKVIGVNKLIEEKSQSAPWLAAQFADYSVLLDKQLENDLRAKRAFKSADEVKRIRKEKRDAIKKSKLLEYQLSFYEALFPWLVDFKEVTVQDAAEYAKTGSAVEGESYENVRQWLSPDEYKKLTDAEKYQLALERYAKRSKSNWEAGIEYERYVGFKLEQDGYRVEYTGARSGKADMGRDLIARRKGGVLIVQCKRYSAAHPVRENTVFQLYGSCVQYNLEHPGANAVPVIYTSSELSDEARACANYLDIELHENCPLDAYPVVKCNIGAGGEKIYHLPFDLQYDAVVITTAKGELYASTVAEAENKGFRRAYRWHGAK